MPHLLWYKDQATFSWCREHPPSPTLHYKLPTSAHLEAEGMVQAWVGQKLVKSNKITSFLDDQIQVFSATFTGT
jgi:hypothetical protein